MNREERRAWTDHLAKHAGPRVVGTAIAAALKPRKYKNRFCEVDGIRFASRLEARCYEWLKLRMGHDVLWFIRQPSFTLEGGVIYRPDFLAVLAEGGVEVIDAKGYLTEVSRIKIQMVEARYGLKVILWSGR